jgi:hypothetical protein
MFRALLAALFVFALPGCKDGDKASTDSASSEGSGGLTFTPPEAGRGTTVDARITSGSSVFSFDGADLDLGDGVTVNSVTVLDGWTATANLTVAGNAPLGPRDAVVHTGANGDLSIAEALTVVDDSFTIDPARALIGESRQVEFIGQNTAWAPGSTWAYFGDDIEVTAVDILSETYAIADITVSPTAVPGLRDVAMEIGPDVTTLYNGFQVDRVALSAVFDPTLVTQGETVDFTIEGSGTHFANNSELSFWASGDEKGDIVVDWITVLDAQHMYGQMTVSNAAEIGMRDVLVSTGDEGVFIEDAFEVQAGELDLSDVGISLAFFVQRGIDNATGEVSEYVGAQAIFYLPLDPPCPPDPEADCTNGLDDDDDNFTDCYDSDCSTSPACASGPQPYDVNGVFPTYQTGGTADCPTNVTVGAGEHVYFESDCNIVTLDRYVDAGNGMIYYTGDVTFDDYCPGQMYDLHTEGEEGGIGEYVLPGVQPTVPADWTWVEPDLWGNATYNRAEDFCFQWTPAMTYPDAIFVCQLSGALEPDGDPGFVGAIPWDDGEWCFTSDQLLTMQAGPATMTCESYIQGPYFGFPFSTNKYNQSDSYILLQGSVVLE